ncbi:4248_t:CDS:2, partial [Gigaspora margarita]
MLDLNNKTGETGKIGDTSNIGKKKLLKLVILKVFQNTPVPVFTDACTYIPENISEYSNSAIISAPKSDLEQKLDFYQKKAAKLDEFHLCYNYVTPIETIEDPSLIEQQEKGLGEKEGSVALTVQQSDTSGPTIKVKLPDGALTNHSGRKTTAQILQDTNISEDAIMNVMGHKSSHGIHAYKTVNESQKINTMKTLINTIELASNINPINQEFSAVFTKITGSHINFNTNTVAMQDINM